MKKENLFMVCPSKTGRQNFKQRQQKNNQKKERIYKHLVSANNNVDQFIYKEEKKKKEQERIVAGGLPDCVLKSSNKTDKLYILTFEPKECYLVEETNWSEDLIS